MLHTILPGNPDVSHWTILCDFDGTIALDDTTDTLLDRFGQPGWEKLEDDWKAGRINSHDCMAGQVALLDMSRDELDARVRVGGMSSLSAEEKDELRTLKVAVSAAPSR